MPNHAAGPARPRRPRTSVGATPPDIARDVAQVTSLCRTATTVDCCPALTTHACVQALSEALRTDQSGDNKTVAIRALLALHEPHTATRHAALAAALDHAWESAVAVGGLEDVVASATSDGIDAELLCWDVITRESVNHIGLIRKEAAKLLRKLPERSTDELMGYGWTGLRVALRQFNPALGFSFSTYACPRINGSIRDGVRGENPLPKRLTTFVRAAQQAEEALTQRLARTPTYAEIAAHLDAAGSSAAMLPRLAPAASLDELANPWGDSTREPSCLIDNADPAAEAEQLLRVHAVRAAIADLPEDEAAAIRLLCLEERTLADASAELGVEARVLRAAKRRGMSALAAKLADWAQPALADA